MLIVHSINGKRLFLSDQQVALLGNSLEASANSISQIAKVSGDEQARLLAIELASLLGQFREMDKNALSTVPGNQTGLPSC